MAKVLCGSVALMLCWVTSIAANKANAKSAPSLATPTKADTAQGSAKLPPTKSDGKGGSGHEQLLARIRDALKFGNAQQVRDALQTLGRLTVAEQKTLLPELKQTCRSKDAAVLRKMAEFIGNAPFHDLDDELRGFLEEKDKDQLFFAAVGAIAKKKPASALPALIKEIREQDFSKPGNRLPDAVHLLTVYKDTSLQAFLLEKLQAADTYADYRSGILKYFSETVPWAPSVQTTVLKLFQEETEALTVRGSAAYALGKAQIAAAKQPMKDALAKIESITSADEKKRYTRFRMQIIGGLILLKDNEVKEILFAMARDDDENVRARAVRQIGQLKMKDARELLEYKAKFDPAARVQKEAKSAIRHLDAEKPVENATPEP